MMCKLPKHPAINLADEVIAALPIRLDWPLLGSKVWFVLNNRWFLAQTGDKSFFSVTDKAGSESMLAIFDYYMQQQIEKEEPDRKYQELIFVGKGNVNNFTTLFAVMEYVAVNNIYCLPRLITDGMIAPNILEQLLEEKLYFQICLQHYKGFQATNIDRKVLGVLKQIAACNLPLSLRIIIDEHNLTNMEAFIHFAVANNIDTIIFVPAFLEHIVTKLTFDAYLHGYQKAANLAQQYGIKVRALHTCEKAQTPLFSQLVILPEGTITFSSQHLYVAKQQIVIGRYYDNKLQMDYEKLQAAILRFYKHKMLFCKNCSLLHNCQGLSNFFTFCAKDIITKEDLLVCEYEQRYFAIQDL